MSARSTNLNAAGLFEAVTNDSLQTKLDHRPDCRGLFCRSSGTPLATSRLAGLLWNLQQRRPSGNEELKREHLHA